MHYNLNEIYGNYYHDDVNASNAVENGEVNNDCADDYYYNDNNIYDYYKETDCDKVSAFSQNNESNNVKSNLNINNTSNDYYSQFDSQYANNLYDNINYN